MGPVLSGDVRVAAPYTRPSPGVSWPKGFGSHTENCAVLLSASRRARVIEQVTSEPGSAIRQLSVSRAGWAVAATGVIG